MKAAKDTGTAEKLIRELQFARVQLARAEGQRKSAKEKARLAKRRRKEAKEAARRARRQAKSAKKALAEARQVLADVEKKYARIVKRKAVAAPGKKATRPAASASPEALRPQKPLPGTGVPQSGNQLADSTRPAVEPARDGATAEAQNAVEPAAPKSPTPINHFHPMKPLLSEANDNSTEKP